MNKPTHGAGHTVDFLIARDEPLGLSVCVPALSDHFVVHCNMTPRLSGHFSIYGLVFFVLKTLLEIARQWSCEKFAILTLKPQSHVSILIYQMWATGYNNSRGGGTALYGWDT